MLAVSVFPLCLILGKTYLRLFSTNRLVCSEHDSQKTKGVWDTMPFQVLSHLSSFFATDPGTCSQVLV